MRTRSHGPPSRVRDVGPDECLCTRWTYVKSCVCVNGRKHVNWKRLYNKPSYRALRSPSVCAVCVRHQAISTSQHKYNWRLGRRTKFIASENSVVFRCERTDHLPTFALRCLCISFDWIFIFSALEDFRCHSPLLMCAIRRIFLSRLYTVYTLHEWNRPPSHAVNERIPRNLRWEKMSNRKAYQTVA